MRTQAGKRCLDLGLESNAKSAGMAAETLLLIEKVKAAKAAHGCQASPGTGGMRGVLLRLFNHRSVTFANIGRAHFLVPQGRRA